MDALVRGWVQTQVRVVPGPREEGGQARLHRLPSGQAVQRGASGAGLSQASLKQVIS